jgi:hypothetical protein
MGVNHGCINVLMPQKLLNRPNIIPTFYQMRGKAVAQKVTTAGLGDTTLSNGFFTARWGTVSER